MAGQLTLTIGDKKVQIGEEFLQLSPEDQQRTVDEIASQIGVKPMAASAPPKPGTREYADWAREQAMAGNALPQVSDAPPEWKDPYTDLGAKAQAVGSAWLNDIPIAGPTILDLAQKGKAALYGVPLETVQADTQRAMDANPVEAKTAGIASSIVSLAPIGATAVGGRLLGMTGSLPSRVMFGSGSGALIGGADTLARGGSVKDAMGSAAVGAGAGALLPLVAKGVGAGWNALTGRSVPREARNISRALRDDGIAPRDLPRMLDELGPDAMVMDLGPNLQSQAGALAAVPGNAQRTLREAVTTRAAGNRGRVAGDIAATVGNGPDIFTLTNQIIADQSAAAGPLYEAIRNVPVPAQGGDFFHIFSTPMGRQALARGRELAANDGVRFSETGLTAGMVDYAKRALDDIASEAARTGRNNTARQASNLARRLTAATDELVPGYREAREAFAGPAQVIDAIEAGQEALTRDISPTQMEAMLRDMTAGERDAYLQGFQASIANQIGNAGNDVATLRNMFRKPFNEQKLRILLGDDVADDLLRRIDRQLTYGQTANSVTSNSETARRLAAMGEIAPESRDINPVGVLDLVFRAINGARAALRGRSQPQVNARMASFLQAGAGDVDPAMIRQLELAGRGPRPLPLPPASLGLATEMMAGDRRPVEITVRGGAR